MTPFRVPSSAFVPGLEVSAVFYREAVRPVLDAHFPTLRHSAARLDCGSDVLGFDTPTSMDHHWGPRLTLYLSEDDAARHADAIDRTLAAELPLEVLGFPTNFDRPEVDGGVMRPVSRNPVRHGVTITTVRRFLGEYLGADPSRDFTVVDWLVMPAQRLRTVASGAVFHDGLGELTPARERLRWYPRDVWLYVLASQWHRIDQEEAFAARCGDVGDELGSKVVAARQVSELMRLCFVLERQYPPYYKWFGSAFARLEGAARLAPTLDGALRAAGWRQRERHLSAAYVAVAEMHNALALTRPLEARVMPFHGRPYRVLRAERFMDALYDEIASEEVLRLPKALGAVWQFADSTDVLDETERFRAVAGVYGNRESGIGNQGMGSG